MKPIHHHNHCHKIKSLSNRAKLSQPMAQSLQLSEVPTPISAPSGSTETIPERWDMSKILVDNGSQAEIFFYPPLKRLFMTRNSSRNQRSPSMASAAKELSLLE
jgi:hypothetical protein